MWHKDSEENVFIKPYLYHKDQQGKWGDDFGKSFPITGSIKKGVWYKVKMMAQSNTANYKNGLIRISVNDTLLIDQAIRWTTDDSKRLINRTTLYTPLSFSKVLLQEEHLIASTIFFRF